MAANSLKETHYFHKDATTVGVGEDYKIYSQVDMVKFEVRISEGGTFSASVKAKLEYDSPWKPYPAIQNSDTYSIGSTITDASCLYEIDTRAIYSLRVELTAITGTASIYCKAVG
jgi:hypothetical protein